MSKATINNSTSNNHTPPRNLELTLQETTTKGSKCVSSMSLTKDNRTLKKFVHNPKEIVRGLNAIQSYLRMSQGIQSTLTVKMDLLSW